MGLLLLLCGPLLALVRWLGAWGGGAGVSRPLSHGDLLLVLVLVMVFVEMEVTVAPTIIDMVLMLPMLLVRVAAVAMEAEVLNYG